MRSFWTDRRFLATTAILSIFAAQSVWAQHGGGAGGSAPGSSTGGLGGAGGLGSTTRGNVPGTTTTPTLGTNPNSIPSTMNRPIFLSGKVMFDDGGQPNADIRIERVCGGSSRLEAHTDSKGRFSFQVGQQPAAFSDASETPGNTLGVPNNQTNSPGYGATASSASRLDPLWGCELRATYPGFRSDMIDLSSRRSLDNPDLGTIVLHRLVNVKGTTISLTTELAPKHAQKEYEKGLQAAQKGRLDDAEKDLTQATDVYPKYAIAWFALGQVQERQAKADGARASYIKSSQADDKYVSPLERLAYLSVHDSKWDDAAGYSKRAIELDPVEFPSAFWYNGIANYNLHKEAEAEKSLAELIKLDTGHHFPEAENLMAQLMLNKGKYSEAAEHLRAYLTLVPNAKNANELKEALQKLDQASAQPKPLQSPQ